MIGGHNQECYYLIEHPQDGVLTANMNVFNPNFSFQTWKNIYHSWMIVVQVLGVLHFLSWADVFAPDL